MNEHELLAALEKAHEKLVVPIRIGDGLPKKEYEEFCEILKSVHFFYINSTTIPKIAANIFLDTYPGLMACAELYPESEREEIFLAADKIAELTRKCLV